MPRFQTYWIVIAICGIGLAYGQATHETSNADRPEPPPLADSVEDATGSDPHETTPDPVPVPATVVDPEEVARQNARNTIQQSITRLSSRSLAERQKAARELLEAGVPGLEAVGQAADTEDLDLALSCLGILQNGLSAKDPAVQKAARDALQKLTTSPLEAVSQRARLLLSPPAKVEINPGGAFVPGDPPLGIVRRGANISVRVEMQGNDIRKITAREDDREVIIDEVTGKSLVITVTNTVNGQKQTETYAAKNAAELKTKHPAAFELYTRYTSPPKPGGNPANSRRNPFPFPGGPPFPPAPNLQRIYNPFKASAYIDEVIEIEHEIGNLTDTLTQLATKGKATQAELEQAARHLQEARDRLKAARRQLDLP